MEAPPRRSVGFRGSSGDAVEPHRLEGPTLWPREFEQREKSGSRRTEADRRRLERDREEVTKRMVARKEWVETASKKNRTRLYGWQPF